MAPFRSLFGDGKADVLCPSVGCRLPLTQHEARACLGDQRALALDRRSLELAVAIDPTLHLCPTPDCQMVVSWSGPDDGQPMINCALCGKRSCLVCGVSPYHDKMSCQQWKDQSATRHLMHSEEERLTLEFMKSSNIRVCARCHAGVTKASGCDKMKCRCGYRFCYQCGSENAQCGCTPSSHGFIDNTTGRGDFSDLRNAMSPT